MPIMYKLAETLQGARAEGANDYYLGGGTDIIPLIKNGLKIAPYNLIDVTHINELRCIQEEENGIWIGAAVTIASLARNNTLRRRFPALVQGAAQTASPQIRNVATLGGNIMQDRRCIYFNQSRSWRSSFPPCYKTGGNQCFQRKNSPVCYAIYYSDMATALSIYDVSVEFMEDNVRKLLPLSELLELHSKRNGIIYDGKPILLTRIYVPFPPQKERSAFLKYGLRKSIDFPLINFALRYSEGSRPSALVAGCIREVPVSLNKIASLIDEGVIDRPMLLEAALKELRESSHPILESVTPPMVKSMSFNLVDRLFNTVLTSTTAD